MKRMVITLAGAVMLLCHVAIMAQSNPKFFRFPAHVTSQDYEPGSVLVKLKSSHRELFRGKRNISGLTQGAGVQGVRELIPSRALLSAQARSGPRRSRSAVDAGLYYRVKTTPGTDIEEFINNLYQTGYFERVEPEYVNRMLYTPNDPSTGAQYYLSTIRAFEAWDITKGSSTITIAIVDSGGSLAHEDISTNMALLQDDPLDGIDNDGNGWIDDNRGWDFVGNDVSNLDNPNFIGDNNPEVFNPGIASHGTAVAGCASAASDNGKGIAGVGFNTRLLFTKHSADNQPNLNAIFLGYDGILYAALSGANIINTSWGGSFRSEIIQDMINFITEDLGVLVVAAAGNNGLEAPFYPASYDNVLSVTGLNSNNTRASFSNFGSWIDIAAPGVSIYTTTLGPTPNEYTTIQGTSFSSPLAAGAAALVMDHFPSYTPQQVAEQLRVTSNSTELYSANPVLLGKLGFGIMDVHSALTKSSPAIRANNPKLLNAAGSPAQQGEIGYLTMTFKNILATTSSALEIRVTENSSFISIVKGSIRPGAIPTGGSMTNTLAPFEIQIASFVPDNFDIPVTIEFIDGTYIDRQEVSFTLNPTYIDVDENLVTTTVSNTGRIGFEDTESATRTKGSGFLFEGLPILYEMGIMMGTGTGPLLFNNVRGPSTTFDKDFVSIGSRITEIIPGGRSSSEIFGTLSNSITPASQEFELKYRSLAWKEAPYDKFVIMEYVVKNTKATPLTNFYFGIFSDWDITDNGAGDIAKWDSPNKLGYVYPNGTPGLPHAGIQLLTGVASYYAIDNNQATPGNPFGLYDGFTDAEKFTTLSSGLGRLEAGVSVGGDDVSHVVSAGPFTIAAGQEVTIAFALHAAPGLDELKESAQYADTAYNYMLAAPIPVVAEVDACYGSGATLNASGAGSFKWYREFTGGTAFHTGSSFASGTLFNDTTFYVSNADETYESVRAPARINIKANPTILTSGSTEICENESLTLSVAEADSYLWSNGATAQTIQVNAPGNYSVTVATTSPACSTGSSPITLSHKPAPTAAFTMSGELKTFSPISFTDQSTSAVSWDWDFGNDITSTLQNPTVAYTQGEQPYDVTLIVEASNGCLDTLVQTLAIVTGLGDLADQSLRTFPNPTRDVLHLALNDGYSGPRSVELTTIQGRKVYQAAGIAGSQMDINMGDLPNGVYIVRVTTGSRLVSLKVVKFN